MTQGTLFFFPVPLPPTDLVVVSEDHGETETNVTFYWNQPGYGPESVVEEYIVIVTPPPPSDTRGGETLLTQLASLNPCDQLEQECK